MNERGSALLTVVTTTAVLLMISGVLFKLVISHSKLETSEEKGLRAYYLAEAGIQYGIAEVINANIKKGDPLPSHETITNPFGQGGRFSVTWQDNESSFIVTSTGTYSGVVRKKAAEYLYPEDEDQSSDEDEDEDKNKDKDKPKAGEDSDDIGLEIDKTSRTFTIADVYPYPGKDNQISDKEIGKSYDFYVYIVNNGGHDRDRASNSITVTLIDETHSLSFNVATTSISEGVGYAIFEDFSFADEARVHFHIEGFIEKNNHTELYAIANSPSFYFKKPGSVTPPPSGPTLKGKLLWEKEIISD